MEGKRKVTQEDIARVCKIDQGSVSRILNKDTRDSFAEETVRKVFKVSRELGYLHPALVTTNRRESVRKKAGLDGRVRVVIGTNTVYDEGTVEVDEISMSGMLLRSFETKKHTLPMDRFKLDVEIGGPKLKGFRCRCKLVRFSDNEDEFALAVKFDSVDEESRDKLLQFLK
ncbi:MAG: PilZ domain-containing protein [Planctomycetes bacterium]|nr:PilZ domain-containing protein [Planctomycetota bacterium]